MNNATFAGASSMGKNRPGKKDETLSWKAIIGRDVALTDGV